MTLPPAPADLFDTAAPIEIADSHALTGEHGHVVAGAGEGLGTGMAAGALGSLYGGASAGGGGIIVGILLMPVFAVGGGIYGAAAAHPAAETEAAIAEMEELYDDTELLASLADRIGGRLGEAGMPVPALCGALDIGEPEAPAPGCAGTPRNRLGLVVAYNFGTTGAFSPDLRVLIDVAATASNPDPERLAEEFRWVYLSPELDFFEATEADAALLREELSRALDRLAERIVADLLVSRYPVRITGTYYSDREQDNFVPQELDPGLVTRFPTKSQLARVAETQLDDGAAKTN